MQSDGKTYKRENISDGENCRGCFAESKEYKGIDLGRCSRSIHGGLGQSLQAPQYVPSNVSRSLSSGEGMSEKRFTEMIDPLEKIADAQSRRIDRIEVVQETVTVTAAQKKKDW